MYKKQNYLKKIVQAQEMYDSKQTKMTNSKEKNGQKEFDEKTPSCTIDPYIYGNVYMTGAYEGEINQFVDGPYKDRLLAKVQEAQKAYNDAHIIVLPKGNK